MSASTATAGELVTASRSHFISLGWLQSHGQGQGFGAIREEVHPIAEATWRGKLYRVELEANRYLATGGWTSWHVFPRRCFEQEREEGSDVLIRGRQGTDKATQALGAVCVPLVELWLNGSRFTAQDGITYRESRARELARAIAHELRDSAGNSHLDRAQMALTRYGDELEPARRQELEHAIELAIELAEILEA